jgi:hypothetical protein
VLVDAESDAWATVLDAIKNERTQIICVRMPRYFEQGHHQGLVAVMFRYLALFDPSVDICLFRDLDNVWTKQHCYFVDSWLTESNKDIFLFLNTKYTRQQISDLSTDGLVLDDKHYNVLLSGLWNIRKGFKCCPVDIWHRMFAYIEDYTDFVTDVRYFDNKHYGVRFTYGFDELALSRVAIPMFLKLGMSVHALPIKIYEPDVYGKLFAVPAHKVLRSMTSVDVDVLKYVVIDKYWDMSSVNAGLAQYVLCMISNIYFEIIMGRSFIKNVGLIDIIRRRVYTAPILMGLGVYTFNHYKKYNWIAAGEPTMRRFLQNKERLSFEDLSANSRLSDYEVRDSDGVPDGAPDGTPDDGPKY